MNCGKVSVLKQANQVCLSCLLEGEHSARLEAQVGFEVLSDFANKPLEGQLADEKLCRLLVLANLTKSNGSRAVSAEQRALK